MTQTPPTEGEMRKPVKVLRRLWSKMLCWDHRVMESWSPASRTSTMPLEPLPWLPLVSKMANMFTSFFSSAAFRDPDFPTQPVKRM